MSLNVVANEGYWDDFYKNLTLSVPSQFCAMVAVEVPKSSTIVELGCGNGRDSLYFASQGLRVCAVDLSQQAIKACSAAAKRSGLGHAQFSVGSLARSEDISALFESARNVAGSGEVIGYSRFVMHSINDEQEKLFLNSIAEAMRNGEKIYFEFRSKEDETLSKTFGNHYRRFVDTRSFETYLISLGFESLYSITGQGMAKYKDEDPFVSRLIFQKNN